MSYIRSKSEYLMGIECHAGETEDQGGYRGVSHRDSKSDSCATMR